MNRFFPFLICLICSISGFSQDIFDAARKGDLGRIETLVKINPDTVDSRNESDFTPLFLAGYYNQVAAVTLLLKHNASVHADSPEGPVILGACYKGNVKLVQLLIDYKADVNSVNNAGTSALMYAAMVNNLTLVALLLQHGAKKELKEKSGKTALSYATTNESKQIIALLAFE